MKVLNNLKIGTKLTILIILMLIGIFIVGSIGSYNNMQSEKVLASIYKQDLLSVELLSDIRTQSIANLANNLKLMLISDIAYQKNVLADIEANKIALDNDLKSYANNTSLDSFEKENYDMLQKDLKKWREILSKTTELSTSDKSKEALDLFNASGETIFEGMQTTIRDLVNYNIKSADVIYLQNQKSQKAATTLLIVIVFVVAAICILSGIVITRTITKPILKVISLIKKTSDFDLVYDNSYDELLSHKDEMGIIFTSVSIMRASLRSTISKLLNISNNLAANSEELTASTDESTKTINQVVFAITEIAKGNNSQADAVSRASATISDIATHIGEVHTVTAQSVTTAIESLTIVSEGQNAVVLTTDKMQESIMISGSVNTSLEELSESINKVGNISEVINSIAAQTNLLALNAAIEAARAGESGRGFAVVAEEIRKLAEQSSSAAKDIASIIKDTVAKNAVASENMVKAKEIVSEQSLAVNVTKEAFEKIKFSVEGISKRTTNVAEMLSTIDTAAQDISSHTHDMAAIAEQTAASSEEISASSEQQLASIEMISNAASDLSGMAIEINNEISKFKL
ncbi:MAG TPA: methyl-accepting chemotaxis protein [Ruminiclostridium sp.]